MVVVSCQISDEEKKQIEEKTDNISDFIRESISEKLGTTKSLEKIQSDYFESALKLDEIERTYFEMVENKLKTDKTISIAEYEKLKSETDNKKLHDDKFYADWKPILDTYAEIDNIDIDNIELKSLIPLIDKIIADGHRIGITQLKDYMRIKKEKGNQTFEVV